jgi:DNA polymerase-3 subunit beta
MKFSCEQQKLTKALNVVSKAVTSRTTIPILKGIMLEVTSDGKLTMSASDLDISIQNTIDIDVQEAGAVIVMAKLFGDIIRKLPSTEINIESDEDNNVTIKCQNSEFKIVGMSTDEFPSVNMVSESSDSIRFNKSELKKMIDKTSFAASVDEARGVITGVLIEFDADQINMVAIDGYRMAITRKPMVNTTQKHVIISAKILNEIGRILGDIDSEEEEGNLYLSDKKAVFRFDNIQAELRLIDGEFIKYNDILPKDSKIKVVINKSIFMESIERASLLSKTGKNNLIKMNFTDTMMTITSNSEEGNVKEEIIVNKEGDDLVIGFNAQYVIDVLKSIDDEEIKMLFNTGITPCLIQPVEGNEFEYLVLPVRIN